MRQRSVAKRQILRVGLILLGVASVALSTPSTAAPDACALLGIASAHDWRLEPGISDQRMEVPASRRVGIRVPASKTPTLVTFAAPAEQHHTARFVVRERAGAILKRGSLTPRRLQTVQVPASATERWIAVEVADPRVTALADVGTYRLDEDGTGDAWLFVGASIQAAAIDHRRFKAAAQARFGTDPIAINRAVGGWTSGDLRDALPAILSAHSEARYVLIHIGGNDVTGSRPYPGGAKALADNLRAILTIVTAAGKIPVLGRLSYRRYEDRPGQPPRASRGSGPYVEALYDPLIARGCPAIAEAPVDLYGLTREQPGLLASDGVHLTEEGSEAFERRWLLTVGGVVYRALGEEGSGGVQPRP